MRTAFLNFLAAEGVIGSERLDQMEGLLHAAPEPIGSIAFSYGMITGRDIDAILDDQRGRHRPFGEIAVSKGLLAPEQIETLLLIQQTRAATSVAEALALASVCPLGQVSRQLGRFLSNHQESIRCAND
jgi:hypothetical protein